MGTRNLTMVVSNGETKVGQYGQWDGYPSGQGATALSILSEIAKENGWEKFREKINSLRWFTTEELEKMDGDYDNAIAKHPYISRDWAAVILEGLYRGKLTKHENYPVSKTTIIDVNIEALINSENFGGDSLFCEWAYVIDLDKMTFEVYRGFNKEPLVEGDRFYELQDKLIAEKAAKGRQVEYYPVKLVKSYDLNNLPDGRTFCNECERQEEEDVEDDTENNTAEA